MMHRAHHSKLIGNQAKLLTYTCKNAQVVTSLQTSCPNVVVFALLVPSLMEQVVNNLKQT